MGLGDEAGLKTVKEIESTALPHAAQLANDIIANAAVLLTGSITALDGFRILLTQDLATKFVEPILAESREWRGILERGLHGTVNGNIPFEIQSKTKT